MNSKNFVLGGDIKKSLLEGYQLDFKTLFKDTFIITRKNFLPLLIASLFIVLLLSFIFTLFVDENTSLDDLRIVGGAFIFALLIAPPLMTGLLMMGVHHSIGLKTKPFFVFNYFKLIFKLSLAAMIINLITNVTSMLLSQFFGSTGFILSLIVMLYLKMSFCLVYPLIAEKKVSAQVALKLSFKLVHKNIGQFTQLFIIFGLLLFIGVLTSGIGLLFIVPFCINAMGIIYRQICGVSIVVTENTTANNDNDGPQNGGFEA